MAMDKITEAIAHFIGVFETVTDAIRMRDTYSSFNASRNDGTAHKDEPVAPNNIRENYELQGFQPIVDYAPGPVRVEELTVKSKVAVDPPEVEPGSISPTSPSAALLSSDLSHEFDGYPYFEAPPHGSYASVIKQKTVLVDDDYVSLGGSGLSMIEPPFPTGPELATLIEQAQSVSPFSELTVPASQADIAPTLVETWNAAQKAAESTSSGEEVATSAAPVLEGVFVNGHRADEAPKLDDYRAQEEEDDPAPDHGPAPGKGNGLLEPGVEYAAGGNELVNETIITNDWMTGKAIAGMKDSYELNAIIQTNAWWDQDLLSKQAGGWDNAQSATHAFNIASFERIDPTSGETEPGLVSNWFPQHWSVSTVEGDLVLLNWIEQFNFMSDNDTAVLASSGVKSTVLAGGNSQINGVSVADLGLYYDLVIVGGNIYDFNLIQQINVLFDNDLVGAVGGFSTTGQGSISTTGNLLWNQAQIANVGAHDRFEAMPAGYRETATELSSGGMGVHGDVLKDSAFQGLEHLRVLHVKGDLLDLQYIKQTNILGDTDQVALAMNALAPRIDADWTITTGGNALLNLAGIMDVDAAGKTYLAGNQYSQELLVQAEFISTDGTLNGQDPDALVNEAVVFLDDEMLAERPEDTPGGDLHINEGTHPDVMQTMLA